MSPLRVIATLCLATIACSRSGPREPEPAAVEGTIDAAVSVTLQASVDAIAQEGIPLDKFDPDTRYAQTGYFDIVTKLPEARTFPAAERIVRFRFLVTPDTLGRGSHLAIQALYQPFSTGVYSERNDRAVPTGHPGITFARRLFERTRSIAER